MGGSWLDRGHGDGESLVQVTGVPAREMVRRADRGSASWNSRSTKAIVGVLATAALIGSAGTAYAIRETLFPSSGAPTSRSVWSNPVLVDEPAEVTVASVTTSTSTVPTVTVVPADTAPAPASATVTSVDDHDGTAEVQASGSGTSGRHGSVSNTVAADIDDSGSKEHATTTEPVSTTGPTVPESGSGGVATTDASESGRGSSGSGSGSDDDSDNSGSRHSGGDDDRSGSGHSGGDDDRSGRDDRSDSDDGSDSDD